MKKSIIFTFFAAIILFLTAAKPFQAHDDPEQLKKVLINFFNGIETKDFAKLRMATTSDFMLYEDGSIWNTDSAFMNIKRHMPFTVKYEMKNIKINVDTQSGDVTYTNHADFVFAKGKESLDWVESATFRKINGVWKINFLQATIRK